jgi:hypothetical protein
MEKIKYGEVDITQLHFGLYYGDPSSNESYELIMVLSVAKTINEMKMCLLVHDISYMNAVKDVENEINYYLSLNHPDPIGYLINYHCNCALANVYSKVRFNFVEKITKNNILYYFKTQSKIINIYNNSYVFEYKKKYFSICVDNIFNQALERKIQNTVFDYNNNLLHLYEIIFFKVPTANQFELSELPSIVEFSKWLYKLEIINFCNILNYLKKIKLINSRNIDSLLRLFLLNKKQYDNSLIHT